MIPAHELNGNKEVKEGFVQYLQSTSPATSATGLDTSTLPKYRGHIFTYPDSWLAHEIGKDSTFLASDNFCFGEPEFKLLSCPFDWIKSGDVTGKEGAGRQSERMKAHAAYRNYLRHCIDRDKNKFGTDWKGMTVRGSVLQDLDSMDKKIKDSNLWNYLSKLSAQRRHEKLAAIQTLNPEEDTNIRECINTWNKSDVKKQKVKEMNKVWNKAQAGNRVTEAEFNACANLCKLELHNLNTDRNSAYSFSNKDYCSKRPKFVPESTLAEEEDAFTRNYHQVPIGWNADAPPKDNPGKEPSGYVLTVLGDVPGMKKQEATAVAFTPRVKDLCEKYRDLKDAFFPVRI